MKVVAIDVFPLSVPYRHTETSSRVQRRGVTNVVVKLSTDAGVVGWGESCSGADTASIVAAVSAMTPFVVGRDPWELNAIAQDVYKAGLWDYQLQTANFAFAGIDIALWDLCGKDCGQPLHRLLGGLQRSYVDYFYYLATGNVEFIAQQCRDGIERGYSCFYLKVGIDARAEEAILETIRSVIGPHRKIRIDANEAWSLAEATRLLTRWNDRFVIDFAEAPVRAFPLSITRKLRMLVDVNICANEGLSGESEVVRTIDDAAVDVLCFSSYWVGTLRRFHALSHNAHLGGIGVCKHTHGEFGVAAAAAHHVMLALPNTVDGCQQTAAVMVDDILEEPLPIAVGPRWGVIEAPGLGVEVDEGKVRRFNLAYMNGGQFLPYDLPAA